MIVVRSLVGVEVRLDFEGQESKHTRVGILFGIICSLNMSIHYPLFVQNFDELKLHFLSKVEHIFNVLPISIFS